MNTWNSQNNFFNNYPQGYVPSYQEKTGEECYEEEPMTYSISMPSPEEEEFRLSRLFREELSRRKLERKREKNRQASARYRERRETLLAILESRTERIEKKIVELEETLKRRMEELAQLKAQATDGYGIVLVGGNEYAEL